MHFAPPWFVELKDALQRNPQLGTQSMKPDQVAVAARCLNIDLEIATQRAQEVGDGIIRVSSDIRGVGSVLIGPDLTALFFASYISPDEAMEAWESGLRTPLESFEALHRK